MRWASRDLGLDTAFLARAGDGPVRIALCAEYDALPGLGHACGHNPIAASSVGAALGLAAIADELGLTVEVYGTPAEEGGGKIELLDRGAFAGVDLPGYGGASRRARWPPAERWTSNRRASPTRSSAPTPARSPPTGPTPRGSAGRSPATRSRPG